MGNRAVLQSVLEEFEDLDVTLVALTQQTPEHSVILMEIQALNFHVLPGPGNNYEAQSGPPFDAPADLKEIYRGFGVDPPKYNGEDRWTLPVPGWIAANSSGEMIAIDIDADYTY